MFQLIRITIKTHRNLYLHTYGRVSMQAAKSTNELFNEEPACGALPPHDNFCLTKERNTVVERSAKRTNFIVQNS